jgi:hypothetical protein
MRGVDEYLFGSGTQVDIRVIGAGVAPVHGRIYVTGHDRVMVQAYARPLALIVFSAAAGARVRIPIDILSTHGVQPGDTIVAGATDIQVIGGIRWIR